jgi:NADP-dependent 3-hydroxy acid dehydrogenase YdfG
MGWQSRPRDRVEPRLGYWIALHLAHADVDLAATARGLSALDALPNAVEAGGRRCLALELDVRDVRGIEAAVTRVRSAFGRFDVLVDNAGINIRVRR